MRAPNGLRLFHDLPTKERYLLIEQAVTAMPRTFTTEQVQAVLERLQIGATQASTTDVNNHLRRLGKYVKELPVKPHKIKGRFQYYWERVA